MPPLDTARGEDKKIEDGDGLSTLKCNLILVMDDLTGVGQGRWLDKRDKANRRAVQLDNFLKGGVVPPGMTEGNMLDMCEFCKALVPVYDLLGSNDAKAMADEERSAHMEMASKGSKANCAMVNFFIGMEKKYKLGGGIIELMDDLFGSSGLQRELEGAAYADFSTGVYGMVIAYVGLKYKHPEYDWRGATEEEDRRMGGDLVGEMGDGENKKICIAEVKSGNYVPKYLEFDLDDPRAMNGVVEIARGRRVESRIVMGLKKISRLMSERRSDEIDRRKYLWVYVPVARNKDQEQ